MNEQGGVLDAGWLSPPCSWLYSLFFGLAYRSSFNVQGFLISIPHNPDPTVPPPALINRFTKPAYT